MVSICIRHLSDGNSRMEELSLARPFEEGGYVKVIMNNLKWVFVINRILSRERNI